MKSKNKIIPIFGDGESERDKKMDDKMKKDLLEDSDKEEERLLNDPALRDITALDDMLGKIMGELREQGKLRAEDIIEETERPEIQSTVDGLSVEDREALLLGRMVKASGAGVDDIRRVLENPTDECSGDGRKRGNRRRNRRKSIGSGGRAKIVARNFAIGAASFVILVGGSMSTSAGREYVSNIVAVVMERINGGGLIIGNYNEDGEADTDEELAYKDIFDTIAVNPLNFVYLPEELAFEGYDIWVDNNRATIRYGVDENKMTITGEKVGDKVKNTAKVDGVKVRIVDTTLNYLTIDVYELVNSNDGSKTYTAYFTYEGNQYTIASNCDMDTFILMLESLEIG